MTYLAIYHKPEDILNIVEGQDLAVRRLPKPLPVGVAGLYGGPNPVDELGIGDSDLQEGVLCVVLETEDILSHQHLDGVDDGLMLRDLALEVGPERHDVLWREPTGGGDVEIVLEVLDMEHHGVAILRDTKQLHGGTAAVQGTLLGLDLLEAQAGSGGVEVVGDWWAGP